MCQKFNKWYRLGVGMMTLVAAGLALPVPSALGQGWIEVEYQGNYTNAYSVALAPPGAPNAGDIFATGQTNVKGTHEFAAASILPTGGINTAFGGGIVATKLSTGLNGAQSYACAVQPLDGKVVSAGTYGFKNSLSWSNQGIALARYNPNGTLDTAFGNKGIVQTTFGADKSKSYSINTTPRGMVLQQPDGKIVVAGSIYYQYLTYAKTYTFIVRYTASGALDSTFGSGGYTLAAYLGARGGLAIQYVGTSLYFVVGGGQGDIARFDVNGQLDPSFGTNGNGIVTSPIDGSAMVIDGAGYITLAGVDYFAYDSLAIARLKPSGVLDTTFGSGGYDSYYNVLGPSSAYSVALGSFQEPNGTTVPAIVTTGDPWVAWFDTSGNLLDFDNTYASLGHGASLVVQPDDKVVAAGTDGITGSMLVVRYNADGTIDTGF